MYAIPVIRFGHARYYDAKEANKAYESTRSDSRKGIDLSAEELERLDAIITPLIKQGQSIHQICVNNADEIMVDERTIYNYIDSGVLRLPMNLPDVFFQRKHLLKN